MKKKLNINLKKGDFVTRAIFAMIANELHGNSACYFLLPFVTGDGKGGLTV